MGLVTIQPNKDHMTQLALVEPEFEPIEIPKIPRPAHRFETISKKGERKRLYLKPAQVEKLISAAKFSGRHAKRNTLMITMAYHHGLRASELCKMKWDDIDLDGGEVLVRRLKAGHNEPPKNTEHDLAGETIRALRKLKEKAGRSPYVFLSQQGDPLHRRQFHRVVASLGQKAGFTGPVYPHRLRHSCGYKLAEEGRPTRDIQKYLGHSQINNTAWYTDVCDERIKGLWGHQ